MTTILVSIISGQTIPNLLLIKELEGRYSDHLFITTREMEGNGESAKSRSRWIERAAGIEEGSVRRLIVQEDDWQDVATKLRGIVQDGTSRYIVNLTGGTKVMSLAVYNYFSSQGNIIYYIPFPKNEYHQLFPQEENQINKLNYRCDLDEYLTAHGLYFKTDGSSLRQKMESQYLFEKVKSKKYQLQEVPEIAWAHSLIDPEMKSYFSGGWFEDFIFRFISKELKLTGKKIAVNVKLSREPDDIQNDNEYDVMFVKSNALYIIEAKVSVGTKSSSLKQKMDQILYKLGAVTRDFGLRVNAYVFTLSDLRSSEKLFDSMEKRRRILGVRGVFDQASFNNITEIVNHLKNC